MQSAAVAENSFKPFLVEGGSGGDDVFRVINIAGDVSREQVEALLEKLPISFTLRKKPSPGESLNEPIEVDVCDGIVYIYPPRHRMLTCSTLDSWESREEVGRMHVDNVMDMDSPGKGQIRTCIHFDPKILGIEGWPGTEEIELEVDIFVYPRTKEDEPKLNPPIFGKYDLRDLLTLIAGPGKQLKAESVGKWRGLIMYAVRCVRANYENPDVPEGDSTRAYYARCWRQIDTAKSDEELVIALSDLSSSIQWQ